MLDSLSILTALRHLTHLVEKLRDELKQVRAELQELREEWETVSESDLEEESEPSGGSAPPSFSY
jgi:uncharacterized membrane protein